MKIDNILLIALHESEGIGWKTINRIMMTGGLHEGLLLYDMNDWRALGLSVERANKLTRNFPLLVEKKSVELSNEKEYRHPAKSEGNWKLTNRAKVRIITALDKVYPDTLRSSPQAPWVLYCIGDLQLLELPGIAMVGTRVPTAYGRKIAAMLAEELAQSGLAVVSGMAKGIDSVVHETALRSGGKTLAVLGAGIDVIYPPENRSLYEEIAAKGLIISEYPPGTNALPGFFPQRNRIIAGLTLGTVVVEADARSGSLITTDLALEAGRDVFSVPGPITSPKSRGTLDLIKQGAKMVTEARDIIEEYDSWLPKRASDTYNKERRVPRQEHPDHIVGLTNDERQIYHMLEQGHGSLDEMIERTQWDFGHLHSVLLSLIIKKQITQLPGAIYKVI
ncbi:DNA-processing protein DprA [Paenibacillus solani]|uniref:DNA-binding protein n=1 Tax=Paenibacillus solani TaxID=1705565 RepID=A0A0M1P6T9_9BACL|nr:DNA-processing protein DprA [Paenibacillus solani]KOR90020.1 DNA-binding protein [Paenibacillus solani]